MTQAQQAESPHKDRTSAAPGRAGRAASQQRHAKQSTLPKSTGRNAKRVTGWRSRRRCEFCGDAIPPERQRGTIYCSDACKSAAWRAKQPKPEPRPRKVESVAEPYICLHCGDTFWAEKPAKTCCGSCRSMMSRARRKATIQAYARVYGVAVENAENTADFGGVDGMAWLLEQAGFEYVYRARQWMQPIEAAPAGSQIRARAL